MNIVRIEAAVARRCQEVETAILAGNSIPSQDGNWRTGDLMILISVAAKVLRDHKGHDDDCGVEEFLRDVAE